MSDMSDMIGSIVTGLFNKTGDEAKQVVDQGQAGGHDLFDLAKNLAGSVKPEDLSSLNAASGALGKMDSNLDIASLLKDGKIDANDLVALGNIVSKILK